MVTSVGNAASLGSFTSAQLATALTDETGSGANVFATSPTLVTPTISSLSSASATALTLQSAGTTAVTIDTSQNVGIGTSSPLDKLNVSGSSSGGVGAVISVANAATAAVGNESVIGFRSASQFATTYYSGKIRSIVRNASTFVSDLAFNVYDASGPDGKEVMRIDSSGNLLVGTTSSGYPTTNAISLRAQYGDVIVAHPNGTASGTPYMQYAYNGGGIGSVTQSGTTAVLYNTTSDYRLKNDVLPIKNAIATIEALKPVSFNWVDGRPDDGFLAHELQAVIPNCVTGEKDAVDAEGKPTYQQMDNSGVIPFLVKAIQELKAIIDTQQTQITALNAKVGI
jgi:hypothetical protein